MRLGLPLLVVAGTLFLVGGPARAQGKEVKDPAVNAGKFVEHPEAPVEAPTHPVMTGMTQEEHLRMLEAAKKAPPVDGVAGAAAGAAVGRRVSAQIFAPGAPGGALTAPRAPGAGPAGRRVSPAEAAPIIHEQMDALREQHGKDEDGELEVKLLNKLEENLQGRLVKGGGIDENELKMVGHMVGMQMDYGDKIEDTIHASSLPPWKQQKLVAQLLQGQNASELARQSGLPPELANALIQQDKQHAAEMHHGDYHGGFLTQVHLGISEVINDEMKQRQEQWKKRRVAQTPGGVIDQVQNTPAGAELAAREQIQRGDLAGAKASLDRAIGMGAGSDALALRAQLRAAQGDLAGAAQDARKALELEPGREDARQVLNTLGTALPKNVDVGRLDQDGSDAGGGAAARGAAGAGASGLAGAAGATNMTAAQLQSSDHDQQGLQLLRLGDPRAAVPLFQKALRENPDNLQAQAHLARAYLDMKLNDKALGAAMAALERAPKDPRLNTLKAQIESKSKRWNEAIESASAAIANHGGAVPYYLRAVANGQIGRRAEMVSDMNAAAALDRRFQVSAEKAAGLTLQLPTDDDLDLLFNPGAAADDAAGASGARPRRGGRFGGLVAAAAAAGLLLALGLMRFVVEPAREALTAVLARRRRPATLDAPATPAPRPSGSSGSLLRGQFEVGPQLASGGMGLVFVGKDRSLGRKVAIKKMRDELRMNPRERERFVIEAKTVAALRHPGIVDIYSIVDEGDDVYLVFEFVEGATVHDTIQRGGRMAPAETARVVRAMAEAVAYAHGRGVIHRDLKPSNVMIDPAGRVRVMDFGIARMAKDTVMRHSITNTVVGTPPYMAPEQEQGLVRRESDVYALAVCAYEMLTGKLPFAGLGAGMLMNKINMSFIPPSRALAGLPEALDGVFAKALAADPDKRYRTPLELASALDAAVNARA